VDELFMDLMFGRYRFKSTHWNYEEALLRLIRYCDRYVHPKITQFMTAIIEAIQQNEDTEWRKGCMRMYAALIHYGLIQDTTLNKLEVSIKNSF
jgi:hemerythrin